MITNTDHLQPDELERYRFMSMTREERGLDIEAELGRAQAQESADKRLCDDLADALEDIHDLASDTGGGSLPELRLALDRIHTRAGKVCG